MAVPYEKGSKDNVNSNIVFSDLREKDLETVLPGSNDFDKVEVMVLNKG